MFGLRRSDARAWRRALREHPLAGPVVVFVATAAVYLGLARAGQQLADPESGIASFWPPNGFVLGVLVLGAGRRWRLATLAAVIPGELAADWLNGQPMTAALGWASANTLEVLVAALILVRIAGSRPRGDRLRDYVGLAAASSAGPALGALLGGAISWLEFGGSYGHAWLAWWGGDAAGIVLVTPLVLSLALPVSHLSWSQRALGLANGLGVVAIAAAVYGLQTAPLQFIVLPPLIVLAVGFGLRATAVTSVSFSIAATVLTGRGRGPLAAIRNHETRVLILEAFIATTAFVGYLICAAISERRVAEERLEELATHDALTGLANRRLFNEELERAAARVGRSAEQRAVIYLDLDDFKSLNDELGHAAGDAVLVATGARLASSLRRGDLGARLGGDEFAVLLDPVDSYAAAEDAARRLKELLSQPVLWNDRPLDVRVSGGVALLGDDADATLRDADRWLYAEKAARKSRLVVA